MPDEREKCKRFEEGLQCSIRTVVIGLGFTDFGKLVEAAMRVERCLVETHTTEPLRHKRRQNWSIGGPSSRMPRTQSDFAEYI